MRIFATFILVVLIASCKQSSKIPDNFDYGKIENNLYTNNYFGFSMPVPETWVVQNKEQMDKMREAGNQMIADKNKQLASNLKASEVNYAPLLTVFKHNPDSANAEFNPSFIVLAENLAGSPGVTTSSDYLDHAKQLMKQTGVYTSFEPAYAEKTLGGKAFKVLQAVMEAKGVSVEQNYYTTIDKRFALSVIISFKEPGQKEEVEAAINKMKFDQ